MNIVSEFKNRGFRSRCIKIQIALTLCLLSIYLLMPARADAQMFSVQPRQEVASIPTNLVLGGVSYTVMNYRGPAELLNTPVNYSFEAPLTTIAFETEGFSARAVFGRDLGEYDSSYSEFGASINSAVILVPGRTFGILAPFRLSTDYVLIRNSEINSAADEFKQNTVAGHLGLELRSRLSPRARFRATGMAGFGYSVTDYGISGGTTVDWSVHNTLYFDSLFRDIGLAVGYRLENRRYNLEDDALNYLMMRQKIVLGITF